MSEKHEASKTSRTSGSGARSSSNISGEDDGHQKRESKYDDQWRGSSKPAITIDREEYLQAHRELSLEKSHLQVKNNILHRRLSEYYKKRKMDHVLKPIEGTADLEEKYKQKLLSFEELKEKENRESNEIKAKLTTVQEHFEKQLKMAEKKFSVLQDHERNTGTGLIYSKKGKPISDKTVNRLIRLQKDKARQASAMMLKYIRIRNAVNEQENIVRKLEQIAPGLFVAQYEQLRVDKQNFVSKIEERDDELIRNRMRCTEHNQILAHIREKMHHTDEVIDFTECDLGDAEIIFQKAREALNVVKTRRDNLRIMMENERLRAGLLQRRDLLRDYQNSIEELVKLKDKKAYLEDKIAKTNVELRECRRCITFQRVSRDDDLCSL